MTIPLQQKIVYGPINSRRLGRSLGINLLPISMKICTFNCVYCQYGWTRVHDYKLPDESMWPPVEHVIEEVRKALQQIQSPPDYITFSGNGEPSLHPAFIQLVDEIIQLRNLYARASLTAILSNSTTIHDTSIRMAIAKLDVPIMKLDGGDEKCLRLYNRPCEGFNYEEMLSGLAQLKKVTIQTLFTEGPDGNFYPENISKWIERLKKISPQQVQIYTLDRGHPSDKIFPVAKEKLLAVRDRLRQENINAEVYSRER